MNDSLNNKELIAVGHEFARTLSSDTPIIDMAKIVSRLAERLDCTTAALREMTKQRDALAADNAGLKQAESSLVRNIINDLGDTEFQYARVHTSATDSFLCEVRAEGVDFAIAELNQLAERSEKEAPVGAGHHRSAALFLQLISAQLRKGAAE